MRSFNVDLNLFIVFDAIYTKRNLTRVAEQLCVTQPAISNALNRLRSTLDDPLFINTSEGMIPTPVAHSIYQRVSEALHLLDNSILERDTFLPEESTKVFRISMYDVMEYLLLPQLSEALSRLAPHISVEIHFFPRNQIIKELTNGNLDMAIDIPLLEDPQLQHSQLIDTHYVCMVRKNHPLLKPTQQVLTLKDYLKLKHIHVTSQRHGPGLVDVELSKMGVQRTIKMKIQHFLIAPKVVMQSDLAFTSPDHILRDYDCHLLELPFKMPYQGWHLYWHREAEEDKANRWLRKQITEILA
ncbi:MAG: LysR family transcriptional regulator [Hahellaceae bacterium]|nr:LysR family transcriptional regulator [Hahellaceae bacterium]